MAVSKKHLEVLRKEIAGCTICAEHLPLGPRPVVQFSTTSRIVVVGQAPGTKVHETGVPWDDASGEHLRSWLGVSDATFYDERHFALLPMGFCYPGKGKSGDAPPRSECAPAWHQKVGAVLRDDALVLLVGQYAQRYYLGKQRQKTLTATVRAYKEYLPQYFVLPHPSWRSKIWMKKNPWFEKSVVPSLRKRVARLCE